MLRCGGVSKSAIAKNKQLEAACVGEKEALGTDNISHKEALNVIARTDCLSYIERHRKQQLIFTKEQVNMAIYIEYDGIQGNVTADGFADHIKVLSLNFGVGRGISMEPGNLANREATRPSLSEVTFSKLADNSTTSLFKESVTGAAGKLVKIKFVQTGADAVTTFMDYELEDCLVSSYSISADADGDPVETISLSFAKLMVNYHDFDKANTGKSPMRVGYDLTTAKPL